MLVLLLDTVRADHLGSYGYDRDTSPHLDALARDGVVFERAISPAPWTVPAIGSIMTSTYPSEHQAGARIRPEDSDEEKGFVNWNALGRMRTTLPTLAELLREGGWATHAILANPLIPNFGPLDRGFDEVDRDSWPWRNAAAISDAAIAAIERPRGKPFLLLLHYFDPHVPYAPLSPPTAEVVGQYAERTGLSLARSRAILNYDQEIREMDAQIGRVVGALRDANLYDNTLIIAVSDHGEEFWERRDEEKQWGPTVAVPNQHGHTLYQELLHVPLIIKYPDSERAGARVSELASSLDILPTLLDRLGLPSPGHLRGRSLLAEGSIASADGGPVVLSEHLIFSDERKAVLHGFTKYVINVRTGSEHFYDLETDGAEREDIGHRLPEARKAHMRRLLKQLQMTGDAEPESTVDGETLDRMRALGYIE